MPKFLLVLLIITPSLINSQALVITEFMYNSPGEDLEFIEFYNNTDAPIVLDSFEIIDAVNYSFEAMTIAPSEIILITNDSIKFQRFYGLSAYEWQSGSLRNDGDTITLVNAAQDTILSFAYSNNQPWSKAADGGGASLVLCDPNSDMADTNSWQRSTAQQGLREEGVTISANPGVYDGCSSENQTIFQSKYNSTVVTEKAGTIDLTFYMDNPPASTTLLGYRVFPFGSGNADINVDYTVLQDTIEVQGGVNSLIQLSLDIINDDLEEGVEALQLLISDLGTGGMIANATVVVEILDDDRPVTGKLQLRGIIQAGNIKAIELYALEDFGFTENRNFGLGSANNGGGSDGQEFIIDIAAKAGDCIFVTNDTIRFKQFYGPIDNNLLVQDEELEADYNGDDAIELYENCKVIDVFGNPDQDGTGEDWEYRLGWAKRIGERLYNTTTFDPTSWQYSGVGALEDLATNQEATIPYPGTCAPHTSSVVDLNNTVVNIFPNPSTGTVWLESNAPFGPVMVRDLLGRTLATVEESTQFLQLDLDLDHKGVLLVSYKQNGLRSTKMLVVE